MYWVYIIVNEAGIYYKGYTQDIEKRIIAHNNNESRFTSGKGPWKLVYCKSFETKSEALKEELRLKQLNKASIERLIADGKNAGLSSRC